MISAAVVLIPNVNLMGIMLFSQLVNGILLPVLLVYLVKIANMRHVMGRHGNGPVFNVLSWATIVVVVVLTVILLVMQVLGM